MLDFIKRKLFIFIILLIGSLISSAFLSGITGNIWDFIKMASIIFFPLFALYLLTPFASVMGFPLLSYFWLHYFIFLCEGRHCGDFALIFMIVVLVCFFIFLFLMLLVDSLYQKNTILPSEKMAPASRGAKILLWGVLIFILIFSMTKLIQRKISSDRQDALTRQRTEKWQEGQIRQKCEEGSFVNGYQDARLNYENCLKKNGLKY